ncbi:hypothetical protein TAMA11512_03270 [Selenomonas sp. TAMA-11512]|uniref:hypothetical protein n=1 Tax=Selenomonas sp. TAMA-11512 TaxID=3095337 RepID=UPI00308BC245|nr:hypothetical protein TAMA11512_03270 [Selenomonas sp. TAMA-11512]
MSISSISASTVGQSSFQTMNRAIQTNGQNVTAAHAIENKTHLGQPSFGNGTKTGTSPFQQNNDRVQNDGARAIQRSNKRLEDTFARTIQGTGMVQKVAKNVEAAGTKATSSLVQNAQAAYQQSVKAMAAASASKGSSVDIAA